MLDAEKTQYRGSGIPVRLSRSAAQRVQSEEARQEAQAAALRKMKETGDLNKERQKIGTAIPKQGALLVLACGCSSSYSEAGSVAQPLSQNGLHLRCRFSGRLACRPRFFFGVLNSLFSSHFRQIAVDGYVDVLHRGGTGRKGSGGAPSRQQRRHVRPRSAAGGGEADLAKSRPEPARDQFLYVSWYYTGL